MMTDGTNGDLDGAKSVRVVVGDSFTIPLWEDRTRGEEWVPSYDSAALALVSDDFLRTVSNNAVDAGRRSFQFRAVRGGVHRLLFEKRMGWKFTAEDRRLFSVHVEAPAAVSARHD